MADLVNKLPDPNRGDRSSGTSPASDATLCGRFHRTPKIIYSREDFCCKIILFTPISKVLGQYCLRRAASDVPHIFSFSRVIKNIVGTIECAHSVFSRLLNVASLTLGTRKALKILRISLSIPGVLAVLYETVVRSSEFTRNLHENGGTHRLMAIAQPGSDYNPRVSRYASQVQ